MLPERIELSTSPLPRECSTTELLQRRMVRERAFRGHRLGLQEQSCGKCVRAVAEDRAQLCGVRQSRGCWAWEFMGEIRQTAPPLPNRAAVMRGGLPYFGACLGILCNALGAIWDVAHASIREIRAYTGLTRTNFALRYLIPYRTVENWERGDSQCPDYVRLLLAQVTGYYRRPEV